MSYKIRIDSFEGPFDLLLYLVSRQKVDIGAISITQIADQYLAEVGRMDNLDLDVASDFLLVASTLLEIKAESLIPRDRDAVDDDIAELAPSEARDMLVDRLLAYKQFKNAASTLLARFMAEGRMHARPFGPDACFLNPHARLPEGRDAGRPGAPWPPRPTRAPRGVPLPNLSTSPRSPSRWRCTCGPSTSAS